MLARPKIAVVSAFVILLMGGLSLFFFTRLDYIVHYDLYRYGLQFSYEWANQYWTYLRLILGLLGVAVLVAGISVALTLLPVPAHKINSTKLATIVFLIIGIATFASSLYFSTRLDYIVHYDLYRYGLQFSYEWANQYWTYLRLILGLLGVAIGFCGIAIVQVSLSTPLREILPLPNPPIREIPFLSSPRAVVFEPWAYAFKLLGRRVQRLLPYFQDLHSQLKKGGVKIAFPAYVSFMILTSIMTFISSMMLLPLLLPIIMHTSFLSAGNFLLSIMLGTLLSIFSLILIYVYPGIKSSNRRIPIETNLPYISSFLTLLSSSNVPPKTIFRSVVKIDTLGEVRQEFSNIVRDVEIFGQDLLTSILENVKYMPCKKLREILTGYVATIRTGGNPTEYLKISTENLMKERMVKLDLMLESLSALAEIYIMALIAMPLLFVVMFATLGMLGGGGAMNPALMLYFLTYLGIPVMAIILIVIISTFTVR